MLKLNVAVFAILTVWGPVARANFISLSYPGAYDTVAEGINNNGQIVGYQTGPMNNIFEGFVWDGITYTPIDVPGAFHTIAQGINDLGLIVGYDDSAAGRQGFLDNGGVFTTISYPGASETLAYGINNQGQIAGTYQLPNGHSRGFIYDNGTYTNFSILGAVDTGVVGIGNGPYGPLVGYYDAGFSTPIHGFVGNIFGYTPIDYPGAVDTFVTGIPVGGTNNPGNVGFYVDSRGVTHSFRYDQFGYTNIDYPGAATTHANGINDPGTVVGWYDPPPQKYGFYGVPTPEPSSWILLVAAIPFAVAAARRQIKHTRT